MNLNDYVIESAIFVGLWIVQWVIPPIVIKVDKILFIDQAQGLTFLIFIFVKRVTYSEPVLRHELEHFRQLKLYSPFGMALMLAVYYLLLLLKHRAFSVVYRESIFEKSANRAMRSTDPLPRMIYFND
jgi:hypothetical protein